jgi:hypothetical protein
MTLPDTPATAAALEFLGAQMVKYPPLDAPADDAEREVA